MSEEEFMKQQYLTLREEIRSGKTRLFMLLVLATIFIPVVGVLASKFGGPFATASMPFITLVLMIAFLAEQNGIIRAGRYLKDHVEPKMQSMKTWENWLAENGKLRDVDRYFFGSFLLVFLIFYVAGASLAVEAVVDQWPKQSQMVYSTVAAYGIGGLWFIIVLLRHWTTSTSTSN